MHGVAAQSEAAIAIRTDLCAIFVSLELSRSTWLLTSLSPGAGEKMSKHSVSAGDTEGLLSRFVELQQKARTRTGRMFSIITIQEAGLDGFWIHRLLQGEGIESWVVDPASVLTSRRRRRAKTDKIDGETLVRTLLAYKRGEPRVCAMVKAPTPEEEDRRRICRERKTLTAERIMHVNRIKGLLFAQGIGDYEPLRRNRRERLEELGTGDGRPLPAHLKAQISRELDRLEIILVQLKAIGSERDAMLEPAEEGSPTPASLLAQLKGIGPEFATVLWSEGLFRSFNNRRQVAAYAGLTPTLAKRIGRSRTRSIQGWQSTLANDNDSIGMALVATPAGFFTQRLVPRACPAQWRPWQKVSDRSNGAKAARRLMEVRSPRGLNRWCEDQSRRLTDII
jgi:transposase